MNTVIMSKPISENRNTISYPVLSPVTGIMLNQNIAPPVKIIRKNNQSTIKLGETGTPKIAMFSTSPMTKPIYID